MDRIRLPLSALALVLLAACQPAPTAPADHPQAPSANALFDGDTVATEAARGGSMAGSGN